MTIPTLPVCCSLRVAGLRACNMRVVFLSSCAVLVASILFIVMCVLSDTCAKQSHYRRSILAERGD